jgi:hypothetical protein
VAEAELLEVAEPLEAGCVDNPSFKSSKLDWTVDGIDDNPIDFKPPGGR